MLAILGILFYFFLKDSNSNRNFLIFFILSLVGYKSPQLVLFFFVLMVSIGSGTFMFGITKKRTQNIFKDLINTFVLTILIISFLIPSMFFEPMLEFDDFGQWLIKAKAFWVDGIYPSLVAGKVPDINYGVTNYDYPPFLTFLHTALYGLGIYIRTTDVVKLLSITSVFVLIQEVIEETVSRKRHKIEVWIGIWNILLWLGIFILFLRSFTNTAMSDSFFALCLFRLFRFWKIINNSKKFQTLLLLALIRPGSYIWTLFSLLNWKTEKRKHYLIYGFILVASVFLTNIYNYLSPFPALSRSLGPQQLIDSLWVFANVWHRFYDLSPIFVLTIIGSFVCAVFAKKPHLKLSSKMIVFHFMSVCFLMGVAFGEYERMELKSLERYMFHGIGIYMCFTFYLMQMLIRRYQKKPALIKL